LNPAFISAESRHLIHLWFDYLVSVAYAAQLYMIELGAFVPPDAWNYYLAFASESPPAITRILELRAMHA